MNCDCFILKCLAMRCISLEVNNGPVVLQQLAQLRQSVLSNSESCNSSIKTSKCFGGFLLSLTKNFLFSLCVSLALCGRAFRISSMVQKYERKVRSRKTEDGSEKWKVRNQKTEVRSRKSEDERRKMEVKSGK